MAEVQKKEAWDEEINKVKRLLDQLNRTQKAFTASFTSMRPRERALAARQILGDHNTIANFIVKASRTNFNTTAFRFSVENIKMRYQSLVTRWKKTEKLLDSMSIVGSGTGTSIKVFDQDTAVQTRKAVDEYVGTLKSLGQPVTPESVQTFRAQLENSYETAKEKFKGKNFSVHVIERNGKIKVRFEPK